MSMARVSGFVGPARASVYAISLPLDVIVGFRSTANWDRLETDRERAWKAKTSS